MSEFLTCNSVVSDSATITDYLIEWRLGSENGSPVFMSGEGSDENIQAQHPFQDEIVLAGELYPVLTYIWIEGNKYTLTNEEGARYSPDLLTCLIYPPVTVDVTSCSTILGDDPLYNYERVYMNTSDNGLNKSREISFQLASDTDYLAWLFDGDEVADQIQIYYCTTSDSEGVLIDNVINGVYKTVSPEPQTYVVDNLYPAGYPNNPKIVRRTSYAYAYGFRYITNLGDFTYSLGDYLRIKITGAVYQPTVDNTNWVLKLTCLSQEDIDTSFYSTNISKISSTPTISFVPDPSCYYKISYNTTEVNPALSKNTPSKFLWNYLNITDMFIANPAGYAINSNPVGIGLRESTSASYGYFATQDTITCVNLGSETITLSKTATEFTISFSDITDYNSFVADIDYIQASAEYINWLTLDNTVPEYFSWYNFKFRAGTTCGDSYTDNYYVFHFASDISYDSSTPGNYTVTFTPFIPTVGFSDSNCNNSYEFANSLIGSFTETKNDPISTPVSNIKIANSIHGAELTGNITEDITKEVYYYYTIKESFVNGVVDFPSLGWFYDSSTKEYRLYRCHDKVTFTNTSAKSSNWKLERKTFLRTDDYADQAWETVYETP